MRRVPRTGRTALQSEDVFAVQIRKHIVRPIYRVQMHFLRGFKNIFLKKSNSVFGKYES